MYSQSAAYGYFLQVVSRRLTLEHSFAAAANSVKTTPAAAPAVVDVKSSKSDMESMASSVASNVIAGALPAFPCAIGDWLDDGCEDQWEEENAQRTAAMAAGESTSASMRSMTLEKELESLKRMEGALPAYPTAIGDWFAPEDDLDVYVDSYDEEELSEEERWSGRLLNNQQRWGGSAAAGGFAPRRQHHEQSAAEEEWECDANSDVGCAVPPEETSKEALLPASSSSDVPQLQTLVKAMDPALRVVVGLYELKKNQLKVLHRC